MDYSLKLAVEQLLIAIDKEEVLDDKIARVVDALGYDPTVKDQDYLISLEIDVFTSSPQKAVKEFIEMLKENDFSDWAYRVKDEDGNETIVDGWNLDK